MRVRDLTTVGRPLEREYATNRAIAATTAATAVGSTLWTRFAGTTWAASLLWGVQVGLTLFLTWALCRELDPDRPLGAFVAAGLALPIALYCGLPELGVITWLLIVLRVVNRTAGLSAGVLDVLGLVGLSAFVSMQGNWGYGVITALAFFLL